MHSSTYSELEEGTVREENTFFTLVIGEMVVKLTVN